MICASCKKEIADEAVFCPYCGTSINRESDAPETAAAAPAQDTGNAAYAPTGSTYSESDYADSAFAQYAQPAPTQPAPAYGQYAANEPTYGEAPYATAYTPAPTPKKKPPVAVFAAIGAVVLVVLLIVMNFGSIVGFAIKTFGSPKAYLEYVESKQLASLGGEELMKSLLSPTTNKTSGYHHEFNFSFGDELLDEMGGDASDLETFGLIMESSVKKNLAYNTVTLHASSKEMMTLEVYTDLKTNDSYLGIKNLSDEYLHFNSEEMETGDGTFSLTKENKKALEKLFKHYITLLSDQFNNVTKESEKLQVGNAKQSCTVLTLEITQEELLEALIVIFEDMRHNPDLKEFIESQDCFGKDGYDDFTDMIDDSLDSLSDSLDYIEDSDPLVYTVYVNGKHEIIGRELEVDNEEIFSYQSATKGKETHTLITIGDDALVFEGMVTAKGKAYTGEYELESNDHNVLTIEVNSFNPDKFTGEIRLVPSDDLLESMDLDDRLFDDSVFVLTFNNKKNVRTLDIQWLADEDPLFTVQYSGYEMKKKDLPKVTMPSDSDALEATDRDDVAEWVYEFDVDALLDAMDENDIDNDLIDSFENATRDWQRDALYGTKYYNDFMEEHFGWGGYYPYDWYYSDDSYADEDYPYYNF